MFGASIIGDKIQSSPGTSVSVVGAISREYVGLARFGGGPSAINAGQVYIYKNGVYQKTIRVPYVTIQVGPTCPDNTSREIGSTCIVGSIIPPLDDSLICDASKPPPHGYVIQDIEMTPQGVMLLSLWLPSGLYRVQYR